MSLILDALKKLEQEQAARRARQTEIRPALTGAGKPAAPPRWRLPLVIAGTVVCAVAVTVAVMGGFDRTRESAAPSTAAAPHDPPRPQPDQASTPPAPAAHPSLPATVPPPQPAASQPAPPPAPPARPVTPEPVAASPAPADLKVTGIAWQDERSARRAVVNGSLAGEGTFVAGARIVEIQQDRVRFSRDGMTFVVSITSTFSGK